MSDGMTSSHSHWSVILDGQLHVAIYVETSTLSPDTAPETKTEFQKQLQAPKKTDCNMAPVQLQYVRGDVCCYTLSLPVVHAAVEKISVKNQAPPPSTAQ